MGIERRRGVRVQAYLFAAVALLASAGCAGRAKETPFRPIVYSPIGEPLAAERSSRAQCRDALATWFARVDANHDGAIDRGELMADAARLFEAMDLDHDGAITPAEVEEQRTRFRSAIRERQRPVEDSRVRGRGIERTPERNRSDLVDPVMSADVNFDIKVTQAEWAAHVDKRLRRLDLDRNNRLSLDEVQALCDGEE
jgi:chloramphenicol 3-O-phosphotransferase